MLQNVENYVSLEGFYDPNQRREKVNVSANRPILQKPTPEYVNSTQPILKAVKESCSHGEPVLREVKDRLYMQEPRISGGSVTLNDHTPLLQNTPGELLQHPALISNSEQNTRYHKDAPLIANDARHVTFHHEAPEISNSPRSQRFTVTHTPQLSSGAARHSFVWNKARSTPGTRTKLSWNLPLKSRDRHHRLAHALPQISSGARNELWRRRPVLSDGTNNRFYTEARPALPSTTLKRSFDDIALHKAAPRLTPGRTSLQLNPPTIALHPERLYHAQPLLGNVKIRVAHNPPIRTRGAGDTIHHRAPLLCNSGRVMAACNLPRLVADGRSQFSHAPLKLCSGPGSFSINLPELRSADD